MARAPARAPGPRAGPRARSSGFITGGLGESKVVQRRLALFGKTVFLIAIGFLVVVRGVALAVSRAPILGVFASRDVQAQLAGGALMALLWMVCRRGSRSRRTLGILDIASLFMCCSCWALMVMPSSRGPDPVAAALLANMVTVVARAVLVPSSARRTLWLSLAATAPTLLMHLVLLSPFLLAADPSGGLRVVHATSTAAWLIVGVATATVVSSVTYGLRREVEEARELGQYTLEEPLGRGGMGEVWRARHRLLIRPAAIKIIRSMPVESGSSQPELLARRFEREARATAALKSPHTVQLYDFGVADDGRLYYVMELLDGLDLQELVERFGPVPAERAIHLLTQACQSLAEAHDNGLIHCDVKPANIFVNRFGTDLDFVKVLDFGLVKLLVAQGAGGLSLTGGGAVGGTPAYMAPEMALGRADYDRRADLYSLGCVAYWLVTGKQVFDGDIPRKVMLAHARTPPVPPSRRAEVSLPAPFEQIIMECLEKDPARRPASAADIAARLRACEVAQPWTAERAERWWQAHMAELEGRRLPVADLVGMHEMRTLRPVRRPATK